MTMNDTVAAALLTAIAEKKADESSPLSQFRAFTAPAAGPAATVKASAPKITTPAESYRTQMLRQQAMRDILSAGIKGVGAGAVIRGLAGLSGLFEGGKSVDPVPTNSVEMPVVLREDDKEKQAVESAQPTSVEGLSSYMPGLMLSGGLGIYGGWKGVDLLLDQQRKRKTEQELENAKAMYADALKGAYKKAEAAETIGQQLGRQLDELYDNMVKSAGVIDWAKTKATDMNTAFDDTFPNAKGMGTGMAAMYAIPTAAAGYGIVNRIMQNTSKRRLLEKAMRERARRQNAMRPAELYAVPVPEKELSEGE